jgi:hypothetical protein
MQLKPFLQTLLTFSLLLAGTSVILLESRAHGDDLVQDYISARAWLEGESPYQLLNRLRERLGYPPTAEDVMVRYNPHPPGGILLVAPFAWMEFRDALRWFQIVQIVALAAAWVLACEHLMPGVSRWRIAVLGGLFAVWSPVWQGLDWGQPIGFNALAPAGLWVLIRKQRATAFGLLLGFACTLRPFFAIAAAVSFTLSLKQRLQALAGALIAGAFPFAATSIWPWEWYHLASDASGYISGCGSIPGVLHFSSSSAMILFAAATMLLVFACYRGLDVDSGMALSLAAAMLTYPLAWFHYDVILIPVVAWLVGRLREKPNRVSIYGLVIYLTLRAIPNITWNPDASGALNDFARMGSWIQVVARAAMLVAILAVTSRANSPRC